MQALREGELAQAEVDRLCASGRRVTRALPRDLAPGDARAWSARRWSAPLRRSPPPTSPASPAIARVTARRYLEYLDACGEVTHGHQS